MPRLLDSMMALQSPNLEFFLIDNGSPDRCGEICAEYASRDNRFFIRSLKDNIGYIKARMLGIKECHGDYVGFCDSDDYLEPGGYDSAVQVISDHDCDLYITSHKVHFGEDVHVINPPYEMGLYREGETKHIILPQAFGFLKGKGRLHGFMWKQIYRKSIILDSQITLIEDLKPWEDQIFNIDVIQRCNSVIIDYQIIYNYIANSCSVTGEMIRNFDADDFWRKTRLLYAEKRKRANRAIEQRAMANALMENLDSLVVCQCKKNSMTVSDVSNSLRTLLCKDKEASRILRIASWQDLSRRLRFVNFCLKFKLYGFLVRIVRHKLKKRSSII